MKMVFSIFFNLKKIYTYYFNQLLRIVSSIIFLYINFFLVSEVLHQYSSQDIQRSYLVYSVIMTIISQFLAQNLETYIGQCIVSGDISIGMLKPFSFLCQMFCVYIAGVLSAACFSVIPLILSAKFTLGIDLFTQSSNSSIYFLISIVISILMMFLIELIVGLFSFWVMQVFGLSLLKTSLINVLAGVTIPLAFYPEPLKSVAINLPFQTIYCTPINIFQNATPYQSFIYLNLQKLLPYANTSLLLIIEQSLWVSVLAILVSILWYFARHRLIIEGG